MEPKANGQSMESTKLFLFGDQTIEFGSSLNKVVAAAKQKSPLARKFLSDALDTIRLEARQTGTHKLVELESLDTLLSSPERFDEVKDETGIIHTTFSCIARLGELILYVQRLPTPSKRTFLAFFGFLTNIRKNSDTPSRILHSCLPKPTVRPYRRSGCAPAFCPR